MKERKRMEEKDWMKDFTKDELEDIENGLGWLCEHNPFHKVEIGKLMTKVKSMIDSHCEHEDNFEKRISFIHKRLTEIPKLLPKISIHDLCAELQVHMNELLIAYKQ